MQPPQDVNAEARSAIAQREEVKQGEVMSLTKLVEQRAAQIYNDERAKEFVGALTAASEKSPKLKQCTPTSILAAMVACVQLDLIPETSQGLAYLIPYGTQVQFQLGYKGLIELCYRSGEVMSINAELVFPEDKFEVTFGTLRTITHLPNMARDRTKFDEATQVYATAVLKNGGTVFDVMSISEITKIRETVKAKSTDAPWKVWPESMAKKTVIKRLTKYLPQSKDDKRLALAVQYDSWAEAGKLKYKDGELIEGEANKAEASNGQEPSKKQLKSFAQPPAQAQQQAPPVAEVKPEVEQEAPVVPVQTEVNRDELITDIKDMFAFLEIGQFDQLKLINEYGNVMALERMLPESLKRLSNHLKNLAEKQTDEIVSKMDETGQQKVDHLKNVQEIIPGSENVT